VPRAIGRLNELIEISSGQIEPRIIFSREATSIQLDASDHVTIAAAFTAAMGLIRLIEKVGGPIVDRLLKNGKNGHTGRNGIAPITVVQFDPEVTRNMQETRESVAKIENVVTLLDRDGAPMVYSPKAQIQRIEEKVDHAAALLANGKE
jgi:hypothetical protein